MLARNANRLGAMLVLLVCEACGSAGDAAPLVAARRPQQDAGASTASPKEAGGACPEGLGDCDNDVTTGGANRDGCETSLLSSVKNCGLCGNECTTTPFAAATCSDGKCGSICLPSHGDCDGDPANGCETQLDADPANCGACGAPCATPSLCVDGLCIPSCTAYRADCDLNDANGCEIDLASDPANCGDCGHVCGSAYGAASCQRGVCVINCDSGHLDCNLDPSDGCETTGSICVSVLPDAGTDGGIEAGMEGGTRPVPDSGADGGNGP